MKKIAIKIQYKNQTFIGDFNEVDMEEELRILDLIKNAAGGKLNFLYITQKNEELYFPKKILEESIIIIITK